MEYIVDLDSLKKCLDLLPVKMRMNQEKYIDLDDVKKLIDAFPKKKDDVLNE